MSIAHNLNAQEKDDWTTPPKKVKIIFPQNGEKVGSKIIVNGKSKISAGSHLWVLIHRKDLTDQWWPQNKPIIDPDGNWKSICSIGEARDVGYDFEIAVASFDKNEEKQILEYHKIGKEFGQWLSIKFPKATSNIDIVVVKKVSH